MNSFFLQGLQHPLLTPSHLIILIALGVLIGQQARQFSTALSSLLSFASAVLIALVITRFYKPEINIEMILLSIAAIIGILIALKLKLAHWLILIFAISAAILIGLDSAPVIIPGLRANKIYANLAGSWISVSLILSVVSLLAMLVNKFWQGIALRILGSWVFASALMALALLYAPAKSI